ncbi:hypothetical protein K439DRAFT_1627875 [Ramaria rubella]|nr:hypothetical protein K439DRAFT_1627875 [Ramaria rubella]
MLCTSRCFVLCTSCLMLRQYLTTRTCTVIIVVSVIGIVIIIHPHVPANFECSVVVCIVPSRAVRQIQVQVQVWVWVRVRDDALSTLRSCPSFVRVSSFLIEYRDWLEAS